MTVQPQQDLYGWIFEDIKKRLDNPDVIYTLHKEVKAFPAIPSAVTAIDECLQGGLPEGRIVEIYGPEAAGKTTVTLHFIAEAQRQGYIVYYIDAEHSLDQAYAMRIGVNTDRMLFSQPDFGEMALETVRVICESTIDAQEKFGSKAKALVVVDSVPALIPKDQFEAFTKEGMEEDPGALGMQARMMSKNLPMIANRASKSGVCVVFINQERDKIGVIYGSPTTTPGGRALKFYSSLRIRVVRSGYYEVSGQRVGIRAQLTPIKSKLYPIHGKTAEFIITSDGIDVIASLVDVALAKNIVQKSGAWIKYEGESYQGLTNLVDALKNNKALHDKLKQAVRPKTVKLIKPEYVPPPAPSQQSTPTQSS